MMIIIIGAIILVAAILIINKLWCFYSRNNVCLVGKTALITGGASGIGYQTALALASKGCRIIIADITGISTAVQGVIRETHNSNVIGKKVDLASFKSVRDFAKDIIKNEPRLDILLNNAGIGFLNMDYTEDELQKTMQVNYFSHFLLTHLLLDLLKTSGPSRVIFTNSFLAYFAELNIDYLNPKPENDNLKYTIRGGSYSTSKLCMTAATRVFGEKLKGTGVTVNTFHPGAVKRTSIFVCNQVERRIPLIFLQLLVILIGKTPPQGAQNAIHLATAHEVKDVTGQYFVEGLQIPPPLQLNKVFCKKIWDKSIEYTKLQDFEVKC